MNGDLIVNVVGALAVVSFVGFQLARHNYPAHVWQTMVPLWTAIIGGLWFAIDLFLKWRGH